MSKTRVDSYGKCMQNKFDHPAEHMKGNIPLFSKYYFVVAIENSNCVDYVTEKLVHAVASGSIPIVAGMDNKPDYAKFMPENSYINVYDFPNLDDLATHLHKVSNDPNEYEKYIYFKRKHSFTREYLSGLDLDALIKLSKDHFKQFSSDGKEQRFFREIILKEKSENKLCKIARYLKNTPEDTVFEEIRAKRMKKPDASTSCLPHNQLSSFFKA